MQSLITQQQRQLRSVILRLSLPLLLLASLSEAGSGIQARFFVDSACAVPLDSLTPYPTYLQWGALTRTQVATTSTLPNCTSVSSPPVQAAQYACYPEMNPTAPTYALVALEWFNASTCPGGPLFAQPSQTWSASNFTSGQCTSAGLKNSSANALVVYAQISCPTPTNGAAPAGAGLTARSAVPLAMLMVAAVLMMSM